MTATFDCDRCGDTYETDDDIGEPGEDTDILCDDCHHEVTVQVEQVALLRDGIAEHWPDDLDTRRAILDRAIALAEECIEDGLHGTAALLIGLLLEAGVDPDDDLDEEEDPDA